MKSLNAGLAAVMMAAGLMVRAQGVQTDSQVAPAAQSTRLIVVSLEDRKLALVENGQVMKVLLLHIFRQFEIQIRVSGVRLLEDCGEPFRRKTNRRMHH